LEINGRTGGTGIKPFTEDEAREYPEQHADVETIAEYFTVGDA
jgi:hypothetical protein